MLPNKVQIALSPPGSSLPTYSPALCTASPTLLSCHLHWWNSVEVAVQLPTCLFAFGWRFGYHTSGNQNIETGTALPTWLQPRDPLPSAGKVIKLKNKHLTHCRRERIIQSLAPPPPTDVVCRVSTIEMCQLLRMPSLAMFDESLSTGRTPLYGHPLTDSFVCSNEKLIYFL